MSENKFDYIKNETGRIALAAIGAGLIYKKGPELIEGTYEKSGEIKDKALESISNTYQSLKEKATTKNLVKLGVIGVAALATNNIVDNVYEEKQLKD
ncbi:hypothetical protein K9L97_05350 [Candidatus Woesearchaeota archaeon]|nr:hypothetical protein [Candidatus Woesearchaeota archaeon]